MIIENELELDISGFDLNALSSKLPLHIDLDTTLTVAAGNCYRLPRKLGRYELATPDRVRHVPNNKALVCQVLSSLEAPERSHSSRLCCRRALNAVKSTPCMLPPLTRSKAWAAAAPIAAHGPITRILDNAAASPSTQRPAAR